VRGLKLKNQFAWKEFCKSGRKPDNIPSNPNRTYFESGWTGFNDWLGNDLSSNIKKNFVTYEEARVLAIKLKLRSAKDWQEYAKTTARPHFIPYSPSRVYKNCGWNGWADFLGNKRVQVRSNRLDFNSAREYARNLNLSSYKEWKDYIKKAQKPIGIPMNPDISYKKEGWMGWNDFLGHEMSQYINSDFLSFEQSKSIVKALGLKNNKEWREYCKSGSKPLKIPSAPDKKYKNEWKGWGDFLGSGVIANSKRNYFSFLEAKKFIRGLNLKSENQWYEYWSKNSPLIPRNPQQKYKSEWRGWADFLGKE
jgi:hypothetical protein